LPELGEFPESGDVRELVVGCIQSSQSTTIADEKAKTHNNQEFYSRMKYKVIIREER
jgi:hypothetical protein